MIDTGALLLKMVYLFSIMFIGFGAAKLKYLTPQHNKYLSGLVAFVTSPLQVLSSVLKPGNHPIKNMDALKLTGMAFLMYFVLIFVAKALPLIFKPNKKQKGCYQYMFIFSNIGYMGYPIVDALFGPEYRFYATIFVLAFDCFSWTYGIALMSGEKLRFDKSILLKPVIIAAFLAYALYFSKLGMKCPQIVYEITSNVGEVTSVLAMIILGCSLANLTPWQVFGRWQTYVLSLLKLVVFPLIFWFVLHFIIKDQVVLGIITVIVSMPAATNATIISYQFGGDEKLASSGVFLTTLFSAVTVPLLMGILF